VYYVDKLENWHLRVKIDDTISLREKLSLLSNTTALDLYIMVSIEEESPVKAPCEDLLLNESSVLSGLTASTGRNSRNSSVQGNFRERLLVRDTCCVFCGNTQIAELQAAHIFDVFRGDDNLADAGYHSNFLFQYGITNLYDTGNGMILCSECHDVFDAILCCVVVEYDGPSGSTAVYKLAVAEALKGSPEFSEKWTKLDNSLVRVPTNPILRNSWPPDVLFKFRETKYNENTLKRHEKAIKYPHVCLVCGKRCKSAGGLTSHQDSRVCLTNIMKRGNQLSTMHTLAAKGMPSKKKNAFIK
jgi:hypothetical protein